MIRSGLLLGLLALATIANGALTLPRAVSSNMVLQRAPQSATIWGSTTNPGTPITAIIDSTDKYQVFARADGTWTITFNPQQASTNHEILISDADSKVTLTNVDFGDVFICSGQSNMEFSLSDSFDNVTAIADSKNYPELRLFTIAELSSLTPLNDTNSRYSDKANWVVSAPDRVGGPSFDWFSATCYYFARSLYQQINPKGATPIPIGVIDTCWGGTRIEAWTTPEGLAQCGPVQSNSEFLDSMKDLPDAIATETRKAPVSSRYLNSKRSRMASMINKHVEIDNPDPQTPSVLFNGMIAPILNMKVRGSVWYQGEANAANATNYACRFPAMINDWRKQFNNYDLWFGYVLLAAYKEGGSPGWPLIRDAQMQADVLPLVHVSSAQDLGDEFGQFGAIHPRNKTLVGVRLALGAQATIYGQHVVHVGPSVTDIIWPVDSSSTQTVILRFGASAEFNQGLILRDTSGCDLCCASIDGSALTVVTSDKVSCSCNCRPSVVHRHCHCLCL